MKIAHCRLAALLLSIILALGILPLVAGAVHTEESIDICELSQPEPGGVEGIVSWNFEGLALLLSACGALVRQVFRLRNG